MFEWTVEKLQLLDEYAIMTSDGRNIYQCELDVDEEDKVAFVDKMQDGKLSYILQLVNQFEKDREKLPKDDNGRVKTLSLIGWVRRHDQKHNKPMIDIICRYGEICFLGCRRNIRDGINRKGHSDTWENFVDEAFHLQLDLCRKMEEEYFWYHDEYSVVCKKVSDQMQKYKTTFGKKLSYDCKGYRLHEYSDQLDAVRPISLAECNILLKKYEKLERYIEVLTAEVHREMSEL